MPEALKKPRLVFLHQGFRGAKHRCKACGEQEPIVVDFARRRLDVEVLKSNIFKSGRFYAERFPIKGTPAFALHVPGDETPRVADRVFEDTHDLARWVDGELARAPQRTIETPRAPEPEPPKAA